MGIPKGLSPIEAILTNNLQRTTYGILSLVIGRRLLINILPAAFKGRFILTNDKRLITNGSRKL